MGSFISKAVTILSVVLTAGILFPLASHADLTPLGIFTGNVGLSIDAVGSNSSPVGDLQAVIPTGATIEKAYLYSVGTPYPWYPDSPRTVGDYNAAGITLAGNPVTNFTGIVGAISDRTDIGRWFTGRADVTDLIKTLATGGPNYSWSVSEGSENARIDGEVLAVVYSLASLPKNSVALLDGGQRTGGETTIVNFADPLTNVSDPDFLANMSLAISFSTGGSQHSQIDINGTRLSTSAGGFDDGIGSDGGLITAGGIGDTNANPSDPFSTAAALDDELYSLVPFLKNGDTSFTIFTKNDSNDDNIFFMGLQTSSEVGSVIPGVPLPSTLMLLGSGLAGLLGLGRKFTRN
jgi:hypothetical protein